MDTPMLSYIIQSNTKSYKQWKPFKRIYENFSIIIFTKQLRSRQVKFFIDVAHLYVLHVVVIGENNISKK